MAGTRYSLEVQPNVPERLKLLSELANDLYYSWDRHVRGLFFRLDRDLWEACHHNPKVFLRRVAQERLEAAEMDRTFMELYNRTLANYFTYKSEPSRSGMERYLDPDHDRVAYFCAEFGLHESLPIYSGGLGILAGDYCKAASDLGIPFVAVGLLYSRGYFTQTIDGHGNQVANYTPLNIDDLPVSPARDGAGNELYVKLGFPGREIKVKVWHAQAGHIDLYLLDTNVADNSDVDQRITYQLYGGDSNMRIQQEIVLGIGGVRALQAMGIDVTVWHSNEGHAAFSVLERCRDHVKQGCSFDVALELVASNTVFTTHTPVPAGHDIFTWDQINGYFGDSGYINELGIDENRFFQLGVSDGETGNFNMTALAIRGSRYHNGVSRIHGGVASEMERWLWPQIPPEENPMDYVTNGVHLPTFLAREWSILFDTQFNREWRDALTSPDYWQQIDEIPNASYWSVRLLLKSRLLSNISELIRLRSHRCGCSHAQVEQQVSYLEGHEDALIFGFARRFATYKRATLLFRDPDRLARLLNDPERPVIMVFAGKAHPNDQPGQALIREIHDYAQRPEFVGKIILLEGYDMALARKLVSRVDVWINTPEYPFEACGTSGMKAGINGVLNLSVLDGWWPEGYDGDNGWAVTPHVAESRREVRDTVEAKELLDTIEHKVIPLYYENSGYGYPSRWIEMSKASMKSLIPQFNASRMVSDYIRKFYGQASRKHAQLAALDNRGAVELADWKYKVRQHWSEVTARRIGTPSANIKQGEQLTIQVGVRLGALSADDVVVECLVGAEDRHGEYINHACFPLKVMEKGGDGESVFRLDLEPSLPGLQFYELRVYPYHHLLSHPFEMGHLLWL